MEVLIIWLLFAFITAVAASAGPKLVWLVPARVIAELLRFDLGFGFA